MSVASALRALPPLTIDRTTRRLRIAAWALGLAIAAVQAVLFSQWVNSDAISYFDMSDAVATRQWSRLVNGAWSPLYPFVVGVFDAVLRPTLRWEFPVAHLVNFACFVFAFACFEVLLRQVLAIVSHDDHSTDRAPWPRWAFLTLGYALFLWGSLGLLTLMKPTPDMLMSGFLYLAIALVLRITDGARDLRTYAMLGVVLAFGYLSKAIMFPLGVVMLATTLVARDARRTVPRTALAAAVFLLLSAPYIVAESKLEHHITFGDSAAVVHLAYLERIDAYRQTTGGATGTFAHPPRRIFDAPAAYEFARPITATYPLWYDPTYWVQGVHPAFRARTELRAVDENVLVYVRIAIETIGVVGSIVLLVMTVGGRAAGASVLRLWPLWLVSLAALGAYALVHVEERYVGAFFALLWIALVLGIGVPRRSSPRLVTAMVGVILVTVVASTTWQMHRDIRQELFKTELGETDAAAALEHMGLRPGDRVARISPFVASGWARLARVTVMAEMTRKKARNFWTASPAVQSGLLSAFAHVGARAVVAYVRPGPLPAGWQRLGTSWYAVYMEPQPKQGTSAMAPVTARSGAVAQ